MCSYQVSVGDTTLKINVNFRPLTTFCQIVLKTEAICTYIYIFITPKGCSMLPSEWMSFCSSCAAECRSYDDVCVCMFTHKKYCSCFDLIRIPLGNAPPPPPTAPLLVRYCMITPSRASIRMHHKENTALSSERRADYRFLSRLIFPGKILTHYHLKIYFPSQYYFTVPLPTLCVTMTFFRFLHWPGISWNMTDCIFYQWNERTWCLKIIKPKNNKGEEFLLWFTRLYW